MSLKDFASIRPGRAIPREQVPAFPFAAFRRIVVNAVHGGLRVAALFGDAPEAGQPVSLYVALADHKRGRLRVAQTRLESDQFESLTPDCPQVHLFEREIAEQYAVRPEGHPWFKPVRYHKSYRKGRDAWGRNPNEAPIVGVADFYRVEGEEIHEVAVGPIHAGVIEPGHFRFQCHGEEVFHLEVSLGYQHRGIEQSLIGGPTKRTMHVMEVASGDTTVGHAIAHCQVMEGLAGRPAPIRAESLRGVALELERLANHTGDLGALAGDVGFLPSAAYCGRVRGDFLNLTAVLCGSRFGRGMVRPGGVAFDLDEFQVLRCLERLQNAYRDVASAAELLWDAASVQARFEGTGIVSATVCRDLGLVGPAARACGFESDVRQDFPSGIYRFSQVPVSTWQTGDVFARAYVRWLEIQRSVEFVRSQLEALPGGPLSVDSQRPKPNQFAVGLVEGWRGEIFHAAFTDANGRFARYKIVDPSFHNWTGLAMALRGQQISDFPLCNKSFNLSYCGHDL